MNNDNPPLRAAVVGCGRIAEHHLKFLAHRHDIELAAVADTDILRARQISEKYGVRSFFSSIDELLDAGGADVIHIVTPPQYHFEQARKAIEKGVHVLVEKPITLSFAETEKLFNLAAEMKVKICPDFINLFNPIVLDAKTAIRQASPGRLIHAECYLATDLNDPEMRETAGLHWSYRLPGGVMQNYITHLLYMVLDWIGSSKRITTYPRNFGALPQSLTDHLDILIEGEKANAKITLTHVPSHENYYVKLFFEKGTVLIDFITQTFTFEQVSGLPRMASRVLSNFIKSRQLVGGSLSNVYRFLRKRIISYQGLKFLIDSFYAYVGRDAVCPVSKDLALEVSRAEEEVLKNAGKVHFESVSRESDRKFVTRPERILVTGATGYVGTEVVRRLISAGYDVLAYVRKTSRTGPLESMGAGIAEGDIRDARALTDAARGSDAIIHIAAALRGSKSFLTDCTVRGTQNVVEAARAACVKRVIYISSFSVYDYLRAKNGSVITEESPLEQRGELRGISSLAKRQAEDIALSNLSGEGPAWTILRPSLIFGNGRDLVSLVGPRIGNFVLSFGTKRKHLKLVHIGDVASAVVSALQNESTRNRMFNLSHEDMITVADLVRDCFGRSPLKRYRMIYVPYSIGLLGIALLRTLQAVTGKGFGMNTVRLAYLCRDLTAESRAFRSATGWRNGGPLLSQLMEEARRG